MQVQISDDEARTLRNVLEAYLPDLRRELGGTDLPARELRQELHKRIDLCERLLSDLGTGQAASARPSA